MTDETKATDQLKQTIVASAAEVVLAQMTPAMMRKVAEEVLENVLSSINTDTYGSLGRHVKELVDQRLMEYMKTDTAQKMIESAVIRGVQDATQGLDAHVRTKMIEIALNGIHKALTEPQRSRY